MDFTAYQALACLFQTCFEYLPAFCTNCAQIQDTRPNWVERVGIVQPSCHVLKSIEHIQHSRARETHAAALSKKRGLDERADSK